MAYTDDTITLVGYSGTLEQGLVVDANPRPWLYAHVDAIVTIAAGEVSSTTEVEINGLLRQVFVTVPVMSGVTVVLTLNTEDGQPILEEVDIPHNDTTSIVAERILMGRTTILIESLGPQEENRDIVVALRLQR